MAAVATQSASDPLVLNSGVKASVVSSANASTMSDPIEPAKTQTRPSATITPTPIRQPAEVECWGHRGASAHLPENTVASFRAAILEGANTIESDVHVTSDGVVVMFHDPTLDRTTTGKGLIREQPWHGVIEHVKTIQEPIQSIPIFSDLVALLMEPANMHVSLNIDCKMQNDPVRLFTEMARIISAYPDWQTRLAPRLILGLWHPLFIVPALQILPLLRRYHIGFSLAIAKEYFWDACEGFSLAFAILMTSHGQQFVKECREAGKEICVWTVNDENEMRIAMQWGVKAVLTDRVGAFKALQNEVVQDPAKLVIPGLKGAMFNWGSWKYYSLAHVGIRFAHKHWVAAHGSLSHSLDNIDIASTTVISASNPSPATTGPATKSTFTNINDTIATAEQMKRDASTAEPVCTVDTTTSAVTPIPDTDPHMTPLRPPQRQSSISESILNWVDTTGSHAAERIFRAT